MARRGVLAACRRASPARTGDPVGNRPRVQHLYGKPLDEIDALSHDAVACEAGGGWYQRGNVESGAWSNQWCSDLRRAMGLPVGASSAQRTNKRLREDHRGVVRYLTAEEEVRLRAALRARDARWRLAKSIPDDWEFVDHLEPLVLLLRLTGARPAEMFALDWSRVDLDRRQITLIGTTTKTAQTRYVP